MKIEVTDYKNLKDDKLKEITHEKKTILLGKIDDKYYAVSGKCTHLGCSLFKGQYNKGIITCPCHGSKFNLADGRIVEWISEWPEIISKATKMFGFAKNLETYEVFEDNEKLFIEI